MLNADYRHHRLLTHAEEIALAERFAQGDLSARDTLVEYNQRLVHKIARQWSARDAATTYDDLVQWGMLGLLAAIERYDPARGTRFGTYAVWWIRQSIQRVALTAGTIHLPSHIMERPASRQQHAAVIQQMGYVSSLDEPLPTDDGDGNTRLDILPDHATSVEAEAFAHIEVERILSRLTDPRHRAIIEDWMNGYTGEEAGARHGLSRSMRYLIIETLIKKEGSNMSPKLCKREGCDQPRMIGKNGAVLTYCEEHQREFWRQQSAAYRDKKTVEPSTNGSRSPRFEHIPQPEATPEPAPVAPAPEPAAESCTGCEADCVYQQVVDLLAQKNPKVRELVDALAAARKLRDELGI